MKSISFKRHRFPPAAILHAVWLYARFTLSFRDVKGLTGAASPIENDEPEFEGGQDGRRRRPGGDVFETPRQGRAAVSGRAIERRRGCQRRSSRARFAGSSRRALAYS